MKKKKNKKNNYALGLVIFKSGNFHTASYEKNRKKDRSNFS
jgi:hypothetical protein